MTQPRPLPLLFDLQSMVVDMALIDRNHYLPGLDRHENDIEHSFAVAMLCWYIHDTCHIDLSLEKILKYALVHDFPERYAGDVSAYASDEARKQKVEREKDAVHRLRREFETFPDLANHIQQYDPWSDAEALFVWTVDKLQAYILSAMDSWHPHHELGITYERFLEKYAEQQAVYSPYCKDVFDTVLAYCKTTFSERPQNSDA